MLEKVCIEKIIEKACLKRFVFKKRVLTDRFPTVSYALVPACVKLAHFSLRENNTRLRHRRRSWIESKGQASVFYDKLKLEDLSNHKYSHNSKKLQARISRISVFESGLRENASNANNIIQASMYDRKIMA